MSSRTLFALGTLFLALAGAGAQVAFAQTQPQPARLQAAGSEIVFTRAAAVAGECGVGLKREFTPRIVPADPQAGVQAI